MPGWMDAIQRVCNFQLIAPGLLTVEKQRFDNVWFAERVNNIHLTTYKILERMNLPLTLTNIYRGALESNAVYNEDASLENYKLEMEKWKIDGVVHIRCYSLKPHACENYDFDYKKRLYFHVARGL
jgi:hypothetical protein